MDRASSSGLRVVATRVEKAVLRATPLLMHANIPVMILMKAVKTVML